LAPGNLRRALRRRPDRLSATRRGACTLSRNQEIDMDLSNEGASGAMRRAAIEAKLAAYPNISQHSLADVLHWFRKEASAHDVALVASKEEIAEAYRQFRADHIDRLTGHDLVKGLAFAAAVGLIVLLIVWRAL
jgi:hypothetical protein